MAKKAKWNGMIPFPVVALGIYVIVLLAALVLGIFVLRINVVAVGALVVLETLLAALLGRVPSWLHAAIFIIQIAIGMMLGKLAIMIIMGVIYITAAALLFVWRIDFGKM